MKRHGMARGGSEKYFTRAANRIHPKNGMTGYAMRGGIRL